MAALLLTLPGLMLVGMTSPANAERVCHTETEVITMPNGKVKTIVKEVCVEEGDEGGPGSGSDGCSYEGEEIPCTKLGATWFSSQGCYAGNVSDMYPADEYPAYWEGHTDGSLWMCSGAGPNMIDIGSPVFFWMPGPPPVDGRVVAQTVLDTMPLAKPNIHLAPEPPLMSYVRLETWLWMNASQWAPLTGGANVSSATVSVTATPTSVAWDTGDGETTTCHGPGVAWKSWMDDSATTDCSHIYKTTSREEVNGKFMVTAALTYEVTWTCAGNCISSSGSLDDTSGPTSAASGVRVGERQSVIVGGNS